MLLMVRNVQLLTYGPHVSYHIIDKKLSQYIPDCKKYLEGGIVLKMSFLAFIITIIMVSSLFCRLLFHLIYGIYLTLQNNHISLK